MQKKGGGFEYVGAMIPSNIFSKAYRLGLDIAKKSIMLPIPWDLEL